uniref:Phosphotyrosine protein phosphatase I domain-containing protein n=1 Tax=Neovison vison TaxID=452646 RepID=A0A8C7BSQ9_NEOVI
MQSAVRTSVLLLGLGSICQSLTAAVIFRELVTDQNVLDTWKVDSATTSKHETENPPDYQRHNGMKGHGVPQGSVSHKVCSQRLLCRGLSP